MLLHVYLSIPKQVFSDCAFFYSREKWRLRVIHLNCALLLHHFASKIIRLLSRKFSWKLPIQKQSLTTIDRKKKGVHILCLEKSQAKNKTNHWTWKQRDSYNSKFKVEFILQNTSSPKKIYWKRPKTCPTCRTCLRFFLLFLTLGTFSHIVQKRPLSVMNSLLELVYDL